MTGILVTLLADAIINAYNNPDPKHHGRRFKAANVVPNSLRHNRSHLDHFEVRAFDRAKRAQVVVAPARIGRATDIPVRSVIRDDHSVLFQRAQNRLHLGRKS